MYPQTFSPSSIQTILVFLYQVVFRLEPPNGGVESKGGMKKSHFSTTKTIQDRAIVTMEGEQETVPKLSNDAIFNDLEQPVTQFWRSSHSLTLNIHKRLNTRSVRTLDKLIFAVLELWLHCPYSEVETSLFLTIIFNNLEWPLPEVSRLCLFVAE